MLAGLLEKKTEASCNVLCQAHLVPAFRLDKHPTIVDLILYALNNTCYGALPGDKHRNLAFDDLSAALKEAPLSGRNLSEGEWRAVRQDFGDILAQTPGYAKSRWPLLDVFWKNAHKKGEATNTNTRREFFTEVEQSAAQKACRAAGLWKSTDK